MAHPYKYDSKFEIISQKLSIKYAIFCIVDMVGLFPVIALPRSIINCGWLGIPLVLIVFLIQTYTAVLLGRCWIIGERLERDIIKKKRCPYGALVELAFGKKMSSYVTVILDLSIFGACVPDLLIAAQNLQEIVLKVSSSDINISYCYWLLVVGVLITPIMWLGSPKDMKFICVTSVTVVVLTSFLTWSSILTVNLTNINIPTPSWESVGIAYGTLAFQFDVHPMILSVQMDMQNKNDVGKAIILAFMAVISLRMVDDNGPYKVDAMSHLKVSSPNLETTYAVRAYYNVNFNELYWANYMLSTPSIWYGSYCWPSILLGDRVHYNTLESLPQSLLLDLALSLATLQVCLSMAVGSSPFFQDVEHSLGLPTSFGWRRILFRSGLVLLAVLIGETVPRFDLWMGLVGGAFTGQLVFLFPPLIYRALRAQLHHSSLPRLYYGTFSEKTVLSLLSAGPSPRPRVSWPRQLWAWLCLDDVGDADKMGRTEGFVLIAIPLLGLVVTGVSTFSSLREIFLYSEYSPPCIFNHDILL